ncbi:MAG: dihydroorotase [Candidatus Margulisbacteria bacterium]|nr:dihydroorotase [Candidatus Margulisiibacteriota bacterium]
MKRDILIKDGIVVDPLNNIKKKQLDILVKEGKIIKIGKSLKEKDVPVFDAKDKLVIPGLIDMHVHLREPGQEEKETILTGTMAAATGGFTSVACMPNTRPVADNISVVEYIQSRAKLDGIVNVFVVAACTKEQKGESLTEMGELAANDVVAFSDDGHPIKNAYVMRKVLEYSSMFNKVVIAHCEDQDLVCGGSMHECSLSTKWGLPGIPATAEVTAIARDVLLGESFGEIHIAHVSTKQGIELIRQAKKRGSKVTCETAPHYLTLTAAAIEGYNTNAKMNPPLRDEEDRQALIKALKDGTIDVIATDHAPHTIDDKNVEFNLAANGIVGLETAVPIIYTNFVDKGEITIERMIELMSINPAKILRLKKGTLKEGLDADITVLDIKTIKAVDPNKFHTKGKNTPFAGWKLKGWPSLTLVGGRVAYKNSK